MSHMANTSARPPKVSITEYLQRDDASSEKLEFREGEIVSMAGATANHIRIAVNLIASIHAGLGNKNCEVFGSDLRVSVPNLPSFSYPDLSVVCGPLQFDPRDSLVRTLTNPLVLVEILSPSTELFDRGKKFKRYIQLRSLEEYLLVSQEEARIESFHRKVDGTWAFSFVDGLDATLLMRSTDIEIPMREIYRNVLFPPPDGEVI